MRMKLLKEFIAAFLSDPTIRGMLVILGLIIVVNLILPLILKLFDVDEFLKKVIKVVGTVLVLLIGLPIVFAPSGGYRSIGHFFSYVGTGIKDMFIFGIIVAAVIFIGDLFSSEEKDTFDKSNYKAVFFSDFTCRNCRHYDSELEHCFKYSENIDNIAARGHTCDSFHKK